MSQTTHTPGPWVSYWSKYRDNVFIVQTEHPSRRVLASFDGDGDGPDKQSLADAALIAAAPDLLVALRRLLSLCEQGGDPFDEPGRPTVELARAALSKAQPETGATP